jgi:hypothetical protein
MATSRLCCVARSLPHFRTALLSWQSLSSFVFGSHVLVRAARACSVCHVVFFSLNRRKNRYGYLKRALVCLFLVSDISPARAAFHLWQVKEVFSNADGSVQFIEMFDSFGGETAMANQTVTANSDGNIKTFKFPSVLSTNTPGSLLIATSGFGSLPGGVTPDFTFSQSLTPVSGSFFNPNATNLTFTFSGNGDAVTFPGATLPKDGIHSLTDANAHDFPTATSAINSGVNSPTNLLGNSGSVNLSTPTPTGDYNGNHRVDSADYVLWRDTLAQSVTAGHGADGNSDGTINAEDYTFWRSKFGNAAGSGSSLVGSAVPEPAFISCVLTGVLLTRLRRRR